MGSYPCSWVLDCNAGTLLRFFCLFVVGKYFFTIWSSRGITDFVCRRQGITASHRRGFDFWISLFPCSWLVDCNAGTVLPVSFGMCVKTSHFMMRSITMNLRFDIWPRQRINASHRRGFSFCISVCPCSWLGDCNVATVLFFYWYLPTTNWTITRNLRLDVWFIEGLVQAIAPDAASISVSPCPSHRGLNVSIISVS